MSITVKLSDYERALNQLNELPLKQARIFSVALASLRQQRDEARAEVERLRARLPVDGSNMPSIVDTLEDENASLRAQIERLRGVLHVVSLDEYESTTGASEKVHAHARQARIVLNETLAGVTPSNAAHVASLENLFLKACKRAEKWETASKDAFRRGAEAMREACAVKVVEWLDHRWATAIWLAQLIRELPIPEEP